MKTKTIIILSASLGLIGGTAFYFFYWRTRNAVTPADIKTLQQYKPVQAGTSTILPATSASGALAAANSIFPGLLTPNLI